MDRLNAGDFTSKLFNLVENAKKNGFGEREVKLAAISLVKNHKHQDNYEHLKILLIGSLPIFGYVFTVEEQREILHNDNLDYRL